MTTHHEPMIESMIEPMIIGSPWTLQMERNGTEDVAVICDQFGYELVRSRKFWRPSDDRVRSETWDSVKLMLAAPQLYQALSAAMRAFDEQAPDHPIANLVRSALTRVSDTPEPVDLLNDWDIHDELADRKAIAAVWDYSDVLMIRPDLTDEQAWQVLQAVEHHHDADVGINWEVLKHHADELFGPEPESVTTEEG